MKLLTPELFSERLANRKAVRMFSLTGGGHGILFTGDRGLDLRRNALLDQAESVAEILVLERELERIGVPAEYVRNPSGERRHVQLGTPVREPEAVVAGGMEPDPPEFDVPWEVTGASDDERRAVRERTVGSTVRLIDDFTEAEGAFEG